MVTQARLKEKLDYSPETGVFTRKVNAGTARAGDIAGCVRADGYRYISVDGRQYLAHRLAWMYVHGEWPDDHTDHINRERTDNRIANLRPATCSENILNSSVSKRNSSGHKGVYWSKARQKWVAQIGIGRTVKNLGGFSDLHDAIAARQSAEFGEKA